MVVEEDPTEEKSIVYYIEDDIVKCTEMFMSEDHKDLAQKAFDHVSDECAKMII